MYRTAQEPVYPLQCAPEHPLAPRKCDKELNKCDKELNKCDRAPGKCYKLLGEYDKQLGEFPGLCPVERGKGFQCNHIRMVIDIIYVFRRILLMNMHGMPG